MFLIIVGAGPVGNSLVKLAARAGHDVVMIEADRQRAEHCADRNDIRVLNANVAEDGIAAEAGFKDAKAIIATTTDDSTNLMAMLIGHEHGIETLTSAVNNNSHRRMFERLGVHVLTDPEVLVAQHLLDLTMLPHAVDVTTLQDQEQVIEVCLAAESPLAGCTVEEAIESGTLPRKLCIISVARDDEAFFARDATRLAAGGQLIVFSRKTIGRHDLDVFTGSE